MRCFFIQDSQAALGLSSSFIDRLDHSPYTTPPWKKFKSFTLLVVFCDNLCSHSAAKPKEESDGDNQRCTVHVEPSVDVLELSDTGSIVATHKGLPDGGLGSQNFAGYMAFAYFPLSALPMQGAGKNGASSQVLTEAYLISFLVLPTLRGRGLGSKLLRIGLAFSRAHFSSARVRLHVLDAALDEKEEKGKSTAGAATHIYRSAGFQVRRRISNYYGPGQDGLEMVMQFDDMESEQGKGKAKAQSTIRKRSRCD